MKEAIIYIRNSIFGVFYRQILKRVLFFIDPEKAHNLMCAIGEKLGMYTLTRTITGALFKCSNQVLRQSIKGIVFENPIGLSAGFDKNARLTQIIPEVGFGFEEVGSITGEPCAGNSGKRLWRLPKSRSLVVYYGLMNDGCEKIANRLSGLRCKIPIGVSIAKTNNKETCDRDIGIADYAKAYRAFKDIGDYYTINISCPNTYGGQPFHDRESLDLLLSELFKQSKTKPVFIKISPDLSEQEVDAIIAVGQQHGIDGFIVSNLTKKRENKSIKENDIPKVGGLSGKVVEGLSDHLIKYIYTKTKGSFIIIGCGGIFTAEDAYKKIRQGASLVQLITGMIYEGPQVVSEINQGLIKLLKQDGFSNISEAVGIDSR